jgi:RNA polymerase sigma factor (sigma-70 family)
MGRLTGFDALVAAYYRNNIAQLRRKLRLRYPNLGQANVDDAIQQGFAKLLDRHRRETLDIETEADFGSLLLVTISNLLIDRWRAIARTNPTTDPTEGGFWNPDHEPGKPGRKKPGRRRVNLPDLDEEFSPTDEFEFDETLAAVMSTLSPRNREIFAMLEIGRTPAEIGAAFGLDGHVLVRVARQRFIAGLETVHAAGDEDAGRLKQLIMRRKPAPARLAITAS